MRAGPLSSPEVIDLLNHYFVPVFVSMEDYEDGGAAPAAEKAEYWRIYHAAHAAKMSVGSVHVYILSPAGEPIATRHVAKAIEKGELKSLLEQTFTWSRGTRIRVVRGTSFPRRTGCCCPALSGRSCCRLRGGRR
jgi:hypothetical protein